MLEALRMTPFGILHTIISLIAVAAGLTDLIRSNEISLKSLTGKVFVAATVLSCLTGFGLFHHGGFGKPHVLGIITLCVLGIAVTAARTRLFGVMSPYVAVVSFSMTFFCHMIPLVNETATRLPLGAPLVTNPEAPVLQAVAGILFVLFLVGAFLQVRQLQSTAQGSSSNARLNAHRLRSVVDDA